jgi:hypothetical protein
VCDGRHLASGRNTVSGSWTNNFAAAYRRPGGEVTSETERDVAGYAWKGPGRIVYAKNFKGDENFHIASVDADGKSLSISRPSTTCAPSPSIFASITTMKSSSALKKRGVDVEYLLKENEGHGFLNEENRFAFYEAMERFFAKHLRVSAT